MQHIGKNIKAIISQSNYSAKDIAAKLDVSYQYLYKIFNSESVDSKYLFQLSEILKIPITAFLGLDQIDKTPENDIKRENEILLLKAQLNESKLIASQALIRLIRSTIKTARYNYKIYETNKPKLKPGSHEEASEAELQGILFDTCNEIIDAINFNENLAKDNLQTDLLKDQVNQFMQAFPNEEPYNEEKLKLDKLLNKFVRFIDESNPSHLNENKGGENY